MIRKADLLQPRPARRLDPVDRLFEVFSIASENSLAKRADLGDGDGQNARQRTQPEGADEDQRQDQRLERADRQS
jgi:hypothetical protein